MSMDIKINRRFNEKDLPDVKTIKDRGDKLAKEVTIKETEFMRHYGVKSEGEYKRRCMKEGHIMKHSHTGWNSIEYSAETFKKIYNTLKDAGSYVDRFGVCLDGSMGVPEEDRDKVVVGSGQVYRSDEEWSLLGQITPACIHMGDHMIGSLNSVNNCMNALNAGVTTIGNASHYFSYEYPGFDMEEKRTFDVCTAFRIMGNFRETGSIIHSNLDDGYGAQFHDLANLVGWARLERYCVEDLLGGAMNHCFGNLFSDPILRIIFSKAMWNINTFQTPGSMIYGNTTDFADNYPKNYGALASFSMADIIGQMKWPTGHAVTAIPVTEAVRVPSAEEIIDAEFVLDIMLEKAADYAKFIDFDAIEAQADTLTKCGTIFFERVINALDDLGTDIEHPGEVLAMLKAIGPERLEINFGSGKKDLNAIRTRVPVYPTNIVKDINKQSDNLMATLHGVEGNPLDGMNIVIGTTDIHIFGKEVVKRVLRTAGANLYDLGDAVSADEFADTLIETESKVLCVSTYNGMAYGFAQELDKKLKEKGLDDVLVIFGGRLNEAVDGEDLPVDVSDKLQAMGINTDNDAQKLVDTLTALNKKA